MHQSALPTAVLGNIIATFAMLLVMCQGRHESIMSKRVGSDGFVHQRQLLQGDSNASTATMTDSHDCPNEPAGSGNWVVVNFADSSLGFLSLGACVESTDPQMYCYEPLDRDHTDAGVTIPADTTFDVIGDMQKTRVQFHYTNECKDEVASGTWIFYTPGHWKLNEEVELKSILMYNSPAYNPPELTNENTMPFEG